MICEKGKSIETIIHYADFCVVGGGLSGMCAAIEAARHGSKVVLMQERPVLGGNASSEIRMWVCGAHGENNRASGIIEEMELENMYRNPSKDYYLWNTVLLDFVMREKNITLLLNCTCMKAEMAREHIESVLGWQMTTQTFHQVYAKTFADCSGDSVLAPLTGAMYRMGREDPSEFHEKLSNTKSDNMTMGMSCLLQIRRGHQSVKFTPPTWVKSVDVNQIRNRIPDIYSPWENFWTLELGGDQNSISDTETVRVELLSLALGVWDYIKNSGEVKDADTLELEFLGFLPGKRESRRMIGPHILTQGDVLSGGKFEDVVAFGGWGLDDHDPAGFFKKGTPNTNDPTPSPYGIPYRCLYSVNIDNLFFAGRNISTTHLALSSTRVMATCALLGQAVGCAASLTTKYHALPKDLFPNYIEELQSLLLGDGCFLPGKKRVVSNICKEAKLTSSKNISNLDELRLGVDRTHACFGEGVRGVLIPLHSKVSYEMKNPTKVSSVRLAFDSDFNRVTLPGTQCDRMHSMRANVWPNSPQAPLPKTLVRDFTLYGVLTDGTRIVLFDEKNQHKQVVSIPVERELIQVELEIHSTWGDDATNAHIFSFDFQ